ncbi:MAG: TIGR02186 family protein [Candidatus Zixiibacteriota bacterium]
MITRTCRAYILLCLPWFVTSAFANALSSESPIELTAVPAHIQVGALYHGAKVHIFAEVPTCDGAVIKVEGGNDEVVLNKKGKVAVIWLNVAQVTAKNAPQVYILAASDHLANICSPQERERLGLGIESLRKRITFESDKSLTGLEFEEFVKLKEHIGTYDVDTRIDVRPAGEDKQRLSAVLPIPSAMPPGQYTVQLFCFQDGNLVNQAAVQLSIDKVGLPLLLTSLAFEHAAAYGILAIVVAMMAGIIMGIIFSSRAGQGR